MTYRLKLAVKYCALCVFIYSLYGCERLHFYGQAAVGQVSVLSKRQALADVIARQEHDIPEQKQLAERLALVEKVREFAATTLHLPVGDAYSTYADLERNYIVWNVFAVPEFSLEPYTWCSPIVGCAAYRGYFKEANAQKVGRRLAKKGYDVQVGGVRAYSTLGYFSDPVLNTFVFEPEPYLIRLLIHEIVHRKLYIKGDTKFNESFATAVAQIGVEQWYRQNKLPANTTLNFNNNEDAFNRVYELIQTTRAALTALYANTQLAQTEKRQQKTKVYAQLQQRYQNLKESQGWSDSRDHWVATMNNASIATLSNYKGWQANFRQLYHAVNDDWPRFYQQVERIAKLPREERAKAMAGIVVNQEVQSF